MEKTFLSLINNYDTKKILIINKVKPSNIWGLLVLIELSKQKLIFEYQNSGVKTFAQKTF